ncbi:sulfotransferase [Thiohalorhabdus methylotrophus]|uniref:Sulfotransferase n=1 Tax=Thiohalorhabdus methylotrophus TaxID=3242694 RepID=A0ABV4TWR2_9GAMM
MNKPKVFCVGLNKTGTTSLEKEMLRLDYVVGDEMKGKALIDPWAHRDFRPIIRLCRTAQFFQDAPFSWPYTFVALDQAFPGSKFMLTVRDSEEAWYHSLIRFLGQKWGNGKVPPDAEDLKAAPGPYPGFRFHVHMMLQQVPESDLFNKDVLLDFYRTHNNLVRDYFRHRPSDLLVLNVKRDRDYVRFCEFLGVVQDRAGFPWENKT